MPVIADRRPVVSFELLLGSKDRSLGVCKHEYCMALVPIECKCEAVHCDNVLAVEATLPRLGGGESWTRHGLLLAELNQWGLLGKASSLEPAHHAHHNKISTVHA